MRQNFFAFFLCVRKAQCLQGSGEGRSSNVRGYVDGVKMEGETTGLPTGDGGRKVLGMKSDPWGKAKALYLAGKTWKTIASETGLNQSTLMSKASRDDWTTFRRGMRDTVSHKDNQSLESLSTLVRSKLAADAAATLERVDKYALDDIRDESVRESILGSVSKRSALVFGWSEAGEQAQVSVNILGALPDRVSAEVQVNEPES